MSTKQDHLNYIKEKGSFTVDCDHHIFKPGELEILKKYGHWFHALAMGILEPII